MKHKVLHKTMLRNIDHLKLPKSKLDFEIQIGIHTKLHYSWGFHYLT